MIHMPRRSVTRFFIPLIDVLMLMFSMYLVLPFMQGSSGKGSKDVKQISREELETLSQKLNRELTQTQQVFAATKRSKERLERQVQELNQEIARLKPYADTRIDLALLKDQLDKLKKEKVAALQQRLFLRILEIDPNDGRLFWYEPGVPPKRHEIASDRQAKELIRQDRQRPEAKGREVYYLFLFPRVDSAYPELGQWEKYRRWFGDVAHGIDMSGNSLPP
jgi:DNA repair exonuclease SbcCD ATPase subunit